jgi:tripartite-type tricarboxylate transporter receptor subunit TctC
MSLARTTASLIVTAVATAALIVAAHAQTYPEKPITFINPFGAGGGSDAIARILLDDIRKEIGQPIVIENKPGANGAIGSAIAARAAPDGYTLMLSATSTFSINPNLVRDLRYDQLNDFVPVGFIVRAPWMMVVNTNSGFKSVDDFVKAAKQSPGKLTVGYWQSNTMITSGVFAKAAGVELLKVPYKSVVEAVTDLLGERIDMLFVDIQAVRAHIDAGKLRYLAATTAKRVSVAPNVPTLTELGYPSVVTDASVVLFAPAKTPRPIIERWNAAMIKVVAESKVARGKLMDLGHEPTTMTLSELDTFIRSELTRWGDMIRDAGLQRE